ncbi:MAG: BCCT family transporter [Desulfitobacterium hafniense]|nr:BCCT family transporter [Desulfitobacterium hafniense]
MEESKKQQPGYAKINLGVFWGSAIVCLLFYLPMVIFQKQAQAIIDKLMFVITHSTDWLWEIVVFGALIFSMWLALGPYGRVKLGAPDDKPEFKTFTWIAMMFCGGSGAGLVYWAFIEPIFYLQAPPFWMQPFSAQAAQWSLSYGIFHWGFSAWATFAVPAVAFSYMFYVRKKPYLYPSYACRGVLGNLVDGWVGRVIDAVVIIGMVGGMATSLGFVIPMLSKLTGDYFGLADTILLKVIVAVLFSCIYGYSCYKGLYSGIAKLADYNMYLTFVLLGFVLLAGPTFFMFSLFFDNVGMLLQNFIRMSLYTDPITKSGFPQDWTVFYWAWWLAWAIYVALFATRISKGRTIRELVFNMVFSATAGCALMYLVFGGYNVDQLLNKGVDLAKILKESGGPAVISQVLSSLPFGAIVVPFFIIVMAISQATGVDAASYTMANMSCVEIREGQEPPKWSRIFWSFIIFFATVGLLLVGGMKVVQLSSVLTSVPVLFLLVILAISTLKWLKEDFGNKIESKILTIDYQDFEKSEPVIVKDVTNTSNV